MNANHIIHAEISRELPSLGPVTATMGIVRRQPAGLARRQMVIPFEVWFITRPPSARLLVANPTLEVKLFARISHNSWKDDGAFSIPLHHGEMDDSGAILTPMRAVVWKPFGVLTADDVCALDALRNVEHGFKCSFRVQATFVSLASSASRAQVALPAEVFAWHEDMPLSNEHWRELLAMMGWPRPRVFELHPASFADVTEFSEAANKLKEAEQQLFLGHWGQSIALSRIVIESVFRHLGYKDNKPFNWNSIVASGLPADMSDVFKAINRVANHEHHPTGADPRWERADARFLLQLAAILAEYAGTLPPRTP